MSFDYSKYQSPAYQPNGSANFNSPYKKKKEDPIVTNVFGFTTNPGGSSALDKYLKPLGSPTSTFKAPTAPTQAPTQTPTNPYGDSSAKIKEYMNNTGTNRDARVSNEMTAVQQIEALKQKQFDESQARIQSQIPQIMSQKTGVVKRGKEYIDRLNASLGTAINQTETKTGGDLRALAESKRQTDAKRQQMFGNLGTIDSGGSMGYTGQQENSDTQFSNNQASIMQGKEADIQALQLDAQDKRATAEASIDSQLAAFDATINTINTTYANNEGARQIAIAEAYKKLQSDVYTINDQYQKDMMDLEKTASEIDIKYADWNAKNPSTKNSATANKVISLIDELSTMNTEPLTGFWQLSSNIPGSAAQLPKAKFEQLKGLMDLEIRSMLKGQGTVSDAEFKILRQASSALNRNLKESDFRAVLQQTRDDLAAAGATSSSSTSSNIDPAVTALQSAGFTDQEIQDYLGGQ